MQILDSYFKYTGRLLLGRALFFALGRSLFVVILAELHEKPRRKYWVAEKTLEEKKLLREGHHFFDSTSSFLYLFVTFFVYTLSLFKWRIWVMAPIKIYIWVVFCAMISQVKGRKYENLLQFNTTCFFYKQR